MCKNNWLFTHSISTPAPHRPHFDRPRGHYDPLVNHFPCFFLLLELFPGGFPDASASFPASQPSSPIVSQPTRLPACQPSNRPDSQPHSLPASQPYSLPAFQTHSLTAFQPHSVTAYQPHSLTASQPHNLPASQPYSNVFHVFRG